jgi:hypothetical protein
MDRLLIACEGVTIDSLQVPPFELRAGSILCLHMPLSTWSKEEPLVQALTGTRPMRGLRLFGRVCQAIPPVQPAGLTGLFHRPRAARWLQNKGLSSAEAQAVVARVAQRADGRVARLPIGQLPGNARALLGLEGAWASGADAVVFTTSGLDPRGRQAVCEAVCARLDRCAAVRISHAYWTEGRRERDCYPGSSCLELTAVSDSAAPLSPA